MNKTGILLISLFLFSCTGHAALTTSRSLKIQKEVESALRKNFETIRKEGWIGELRVIDKSEQFSWVPPGKFAPINYDSMSRILAGATESISAAELEWTELYVKTVNSKIATYTGVYKSRYTFPNGKVSDFRMSEAGTLIRRKDGWKLISGQTFILK